ncbi:hypothetical protein L0657_22735 [Dyadobacter sp. CY345]|uniref:hypothetical protein n=1 Tax=Dyadobacter sp. CY345 TaxID=2909335 RepID=UPI001F2428C0|nr:hypothetical protein [Dyadobacter sp. CY345]MCF2446791.1 hypothetical protein [Dyadobacter sp. CY345]
MEHITGKKKERYEYGRYATNEALFLSEKEVSIINTIVDDIRNEYSSNIDKFSRDEVIAQLEVLFAYEQRFYERQFTTWRPPEETLAMHWTYYSLL